MVHAGETSRLRRPIGRNYYDRIRPRDRTYPPRDWHAGPASSGDRPSGKFDHAVRGRLSGSSPRRRPRVGWARHDLIDLQVQQGVKLGRTQHEHMFSALPSNSDIARYLKRANRHTLDMSPAQASLGPRKTRLGATVCFSMLGLTLHGSLVLSVAADVVVLPLHTRH